MSRLYRHSNLCFGDCNQKAFIKNKCVSNKSFNANRMDKTKPIWNIVLTFSIYSESYRRQSRINSVRDVGEGRGISNITEFRYRAGAIVIKLNWVSNTIFKRRLNIHYQHIPVESNEESLTISVFPHGRITYSITHL